MITRTHRLLETPVQFIATMLWNTAERLHVDLGKMAPVVFGLMIGAKNGRRRDESV